MSDMIDVEAYAEQARAWVPEHFGKFGATGKDDVLGNRMEAAGLDRDDRLERGRFTMKSMYEAGFSGVTYPKDCGGQGLTHSHLQAFNQAVAGYDFSGVFNYGMTLGMIGPTLVDCANDEQKKYWLPKMFDGTHIWIQFLSEPTGGSDLAGAITKAELDGDEWVINGSKIWTSLGETGDMGMLVARTNWDVPKHRGLSVFMCPVKTPGLEVIPLKLVSGMTGFCQEFFTDVRIPRENIIGEPGDGWSIATRLLVHERNSVGGGSPYWQAPPMTGYPGMEAFGDVGGDGRQRDELVALAEAASSWPSRTSANGWAASSAPAWWPAPAPATSRPRAVRS
jgi:alkylation response protein AidB-like acyl-CoA dehydrogenase